MSDWYETGSRARRPALSPSVQAALRPRGASGFVSRDLACGCTVSTTPGQLDYTVEFRDEFCPVHNEWPVYVIQEEP